MNKFGLLLIIYLLTLGCINQTQPDKTVNLKNLLNEMVDHNTLTSYNGPQYDLLQTSSWDREELKGKNDKGWFSNKDYDNYIRKETYGKRNEYVIMDAKGPGAITRWWIPQTTLLGRTLRIYLDDNPKPVIEEDYEDFISGKSFVKWPFAFVSSDEKDAKYQYTLPVGYPKQVGNDFYLPIPFAKSCKVTLDDSVFYYVINYRMYEPETKVISFTKADYDKNIALINSTGHKLLSANIPLENSIQKAGIIQKERTIEIDLPLGPHAIDQIFLKINSKNNKQMNRAAVLEVIADGKQTVWSPVSEFFGGGVYARPVKNFKLEVTPDGWMMSNWTMPYKTSAKIIIKNYGIEPIKAELKASVKDYNWDNNSMYFHAVWHEKTPLEAPPFNDWNYVEINGKGRYVGDILTIYSVPKDWWGEGDEKIYLNGESFPSQLGTGLEDYYGYAWGMANYFNSPFISMSARDARGKNNWSGYNTVGRMRLLDDIPFDSSLKVDIEAWITKSPVSFAVTTFWYGMGNATSNIKPDVNTIVRILPDFEGIKMEELPGKVYSDPASNQLILDKVEDGISYAGNHLDLLDWRNKDVLKKYDGDMDNILGTAGHYIFGEKIINFYGGTIDSIYNLPEFIETIKPQHIIPPSGGAYLSIPGEKFVLHQTGLIEVAGDVAEKGVVSLILGKNVPRSFRLGVMLDNADTFTKVGKYLWITNNTHNASSSKVLLAKSNRVPDWYFFDIEGLKSGDTITVHGGTEKSTDIFTIGALTFDLNKN